MSITKIQNTQSQRETISFAKYETQIKNLQPIYSFLQVLNPNARYNGQNPSKLVTKNTPARIRSIIASVTEITFAKYKTTTTRATSVLIALSIVPMFFFISK